MTGVTSRNAVCELEGQRHGMNTTAIRGLSVGSAFHGVVASRIPLDSIDICTTRGVIEFVGAPSKEALANCEWE